MIQWNAYYCHYILTHGINKVSNIYNITLCHMHGYLNKFRSNKHII